MRVRAVLILFLCAVASCAAIEPAPCPAWDDWRTWQLTNGGGTAPDLQLQNDQCGRATLLQIRFVEPGQLNISRPLSQPAGVGLALDTSCTKAGYSLGALHAPARQGVGYYQGSLSGTAALAVRVDEPCTIKAHVEVTALR